MIQFLWSLQNFLFILIGQFVKIFFCLHLIMDQIDLDILQSCDTEQSAFVLKRFVENVLHPKYTLI